MERSRYIFFTGYEDGWEKYLDTYTNHFFYWNELNYQRSWDPPYNLREK